MITDLTCFLNFHINNNVKHTTYTILDKNNNSLICVAWLNNPHDGDYYMTVFNSQGERLCDSFQAGLQLGGDDVSAVNELLTDLDYF